jgi:RNA polymerase sigma factor (sigma-70 family)
MDDAELLRAYVTNRSEAAIAELVRRHLALVYFAALRRTNGDAHLAEDIAQKVFITLARQAAGCQNHATLSGWLYVATRHAAANAMRDRQRQSAREREAMKMQATVASPHPETEWVEIRPELDEVMDALNDRDRTAVLLRFFENKSFAEIGGTLRISADAARMRTDRALDKLRTLLSRRGITSTSAALAIVLEQQAGLAAPAALTASINTAVLTQVAVNSAATGVVLGSAFFMSTSKIIAGVTSVIAMIAIGSALYEAKLAKDSELRARILSDQLSTESARVSGLQRDLSQQRKIASVPELKGPDLQKAATSSPRMADPLTNPEARNLYFQKLGAKLEMNIRPFLTKHGFSDQQWAKYKSIILNEQEMEMDVHAAALAEGLSMKEQEALMAQGANDAHRDLNALLGDDVNRQLIQLNQQLPLQNFAGELAGKAAYAGEPLTSQQAEQYLSILAANQAEMRRTSDEVYFLPDDVMAQLQAVLSPIQFGILQQQQIAYRLDRQMGSISK